MCSRTCLMCVVPYSARLLDDSQAGWHKRMRVGCSGRARRISKVDLAVWRRPARAVLRTHKAAATPACSADYADERAPPVIAGDAGSTNHHSHVGRVFLFSSTFMAGVLAPARTHL